MKYLIAYGLLFARSFGKSPVEKVVQMLSDLESKITAQAAESQKLFEAFTAESHDRKKNLEYDIKTGSSEVASLKATISKESGIQEASENKIDDLAAELAKDTADLKSATEIRNKEAADFVAVSKELAEALNTLERAYGILEREINGGASMIQLQHAQSLTQALSILVAASSLSTADESKLAGLIQSSENEQDANAPDAAVYESHSGSILDAIDQLREKAQSQLDAARKAELDSVRNYQLLKQSLEDEVKFETKDLASAKAKASEAAQAVAAATGNLGVSTDDLKADTKSLADLKHDVTTESADHEAEVNSRNEELKALAEAKKIIVGTTAGAASLSYGLNQVSFVQVRSRINSRSSLVEYEAVRHVKDLARKMRSDALTQLASRLTTTISSSSAADVFAKVKGLISEMIKRLEEEASADAEKKAFCDKHIAEATEKSDDKHEAVAKLTSAIDLQSAKSKRLKRQVANLRAELAALAKQQAHMDALRKKEHGDFLQNSAEMEQGLKGIQMALKVLGDYYAKTDKSHDAAEGASTGIIGLLEVTESDFSKGSVEMAATEQTAAAEYDAETKDNAVAKTSKDASVKYQTKAAAGLDKSVAELSSDLAGEESELSAVTETLTSLEKQCIVQPESYAERAANRAAEINGLKEALDILEQETAFVQERSKTFLRRVAVDAHRSRTW